jgi:hypothetical protein
MTEVPAKKAPNSAAMGCAVLLFLAALIYFLSIMGRTGSTPSTPAPKPATHAAPPQTSCVEEDFQS